MHERAAPLGLSHVDAIKSASGGSLELSTAPRIGRVMQLRSPLANIRETLPPIETVFQTVIRACPCTLPARFQVTALRAAFYSWSKVSLC